MKRNYEITADLTPSERLKLEIIHNTYKQQRLNIDYQFNNYLIQKYCGANSFGNEDNFWDLFSKLDGIVDLSDPDTSLPNSIHALQTAEAIRATGAYPDWFVLCGLIHDFGKIIYTKGCDEDGTSINTQWAIVGDTFITGISPFPQELILAQYNELNNDHVSGVNKYQPKCGLKNTSVAFGHDEYMYHLLKANNHNMPKEAEYIIRYHSLYGWHSSNGYDWLQDEEDIAMKPIVQQFQKFDLYTKNDNSPVSLTPELKMYYGELVAKYISSDLKIKY